MTAPTDRERFLAILETAFERIGAASRIPGTLDERVIRINGAETLARSLVCQQLRDAAGGNIPPLLRPVLAHALRLVSRVAEKYRKAATDHAASPVTGAQAPFSSPLLSRKDGSMGIVNTHPAIINTISNIEAHRASLENVLTKIGEWDTHPTFTTDISTILDRLENASSDVRRAIVETFLVTLRDAKDTINIIGNGTRVALNQAKASTELAALAQMGDAARFALKQ